MPAEPFSIDTNLKTRVSPLTASFIDEYVRTKRNGELAGIGALALAAAQKYQINATYIVAHAALESGWGSSRIAREKHNLYGWSAFDSSPYSSATGFPDRGACVDFVMGRIDALYLSPNGDYYEGSPCLGRGGSGSYGMNAHYASDPSWGSSIASIARAMERAYAMTAQRTEGPLESVDRLIARSRSALGHGFKYQLGQGGMRPQSALPGSPSNGCDCSGFVCWCLGISRQTDHNLYRQFNGGWINTDAIVNDVRTTTGFFRPLETSRVGALMVYPSRQPSRPYGHVGIVTEVADGSVARVIHCSSTNYARFGDAIAETGPEVFVSGGAILAWFEGLG
ncbi:MAG: glucosaminidase domain-containing protein [Chloroflexota bacterium]